MKNGFLLLSALFLSSNTFASICGKTDDRVFSSDPRVGKITKIGQPNGCTISLIGKSCALTAGNCDALNIAHFNVPKSVNGVAQEARLEDQYEIENGQYFVDGVGTNWGVIKLRPNVVTGKSAHEVQGAFTYGTVKGKKNMKVKVISYSVANNESYPVQSGEVPACPNAHEISNTQQVAFGSLTSVLSGYKFARMDHDADTGVNSGGAAIVDMESDTLIGINTHGGCTKYGQANSSTMIYKNSELKKAIEYCFAR